MELPSTPSLVLEDSEGLKGESKEKSSDVIWASASNPGKAVDWDGRFLPGPPGCIPSIISGGGRFEEG